MMAANKKNAPTMNDRSALDSRKFNTTNATAQRARLLAYLRNVGPITTLQARNELGVMHPSARLLELRKAGYNIQSLRSWDTDAAGNRHWQGLYVLLSSKGGAS